MKHPRGATLAGLALVLGAFLALVAVSLTSAIVYYVTPTELTARHQNGVARLYGIVEPGSVRWDGPSSTLSFRITDGVTSMAVTSSSLPTRLFRDGIGVVLAGRPSGPGTFAAEEILVKHSEVYAPLSPGETPLPGLVDAIRQESP